MSLKIKRVYEPAEPDDGRRFLVERLWPRGLKKEALKIEAWIKEVAPSTELRRWYAHDLARWQEFKQRYRAELEAHPSAWQPLLEAARDGDVTLLYSAPDREHNSALVLRDFLEHNLEMRLGNQSGWL